MKKRKLPFGVDHAFRGIYVFFKENANAKIHFIAAIFAITGGIYFQISEHEWLWVSLSIVLVFCAEMFNTSIELLADFQTTNFDERIKKLKDIAAGAVLITAIHAMVAAGIIFIPKILSF